MPAHIPTPREGDGDSADSGILLFLSVILQDF